MRTPKLGEPILCGCCGAIVGKVDQDFIDYVASLHPERKSGLFDPVLNAFLGYDGCENEPSPGYELEFEYTDSMVIFMNTEKYPESLESLLTKYGYTQSVNKSKNLHIWHKPHAKSLSYYEVLVPLNTDWNDFKECLDSIANVLYKSEEWSKQAILLDMKKAME